MESLKHMGLKRSFFLLSLSSLLTALLLAAGVYTACGNLADRYPNGGVAFDGVHGFWQLEQPTKEQKRLLGLLEAVQLGALVILPAGGLGAAGILFYHLKLKQPIAVLQAGTERIRDHDLDFVIPEVSDDELGQICAAFETMRAELLKSHQKLWQQAEERRRLNAAFSHDLRNPVTVLKGSVRLLRQGMAGEAVIDRLETYILRIEQYVEAMSSIQRLEQMPVRISGSTDCAVLQAELEETARVLAPELCTTVFLADPGNVRLDHGIFLTVAENLIGNAARFACRRLEVQLVLDGDLLRLAVMDDGPGFPAQLLEGGPKPFGKAEESTEHFGMGLYSSSLLCRKHGGELSLENRAEGGAKVIASFYTGARGDALTGIT